MAIDRSIDGRQNGEEPWGKGLGANNLSQTTQPFDACQNRPIIAPAIRSRAQSLTSGRGVDGLAGGVLPPKNMGRSNGSQGVWLGGRFRPRLPLFHACLLSRGFN